MTLDFAPRRAAFRALHQSGCFALPNPWDAGSARRLAGMGFQALASTSSGIAWAAGVQDGDLKLEDVLAHLAMLCRATDLPVNADFEAGFSGDSAGVGANVARAVETGVAGVSIEDRTGDRLYALSEAVERIAAARAAIDRSGADVVLVGRSEGFIIGRTDLDETIARLRAYADAGADCLYAPFVRDMGQIAQIVRAVEPTPVNVLLWKNGPGVAAMGEIGVRRCSVGGALAARAWATFDAAARSLMEHGTLDPPA